MNGYVLVPKHKAWFFYELSENDLTIYSNNRIPCDDTVFYVNIQSDVNYLRANSATNNRSYIFFISKIPFENENDFVWTSMRTQLYYHIEITGNHPHLTKWCLNHLSWIIFIAQITASNKRLQWTKRI